MGQLAPTHIYPHWIMFKRLERELLSLAETIEIDSKQITVYSSQIADLLVRIVIEIETISKALYVKYGCTIDKDNPPKFDSVCLKELDDKFALSKKTVLVSSPYLQNLPSELSSLTPLNKAHSGNSWSRAYQAIKHDRAENFKLGTLEKVIRALAALYLLNVYFRNTPIELGHEKNKSTTSLGSEVFAVKIHPLLDSQKNDSSGLDACAFIIQNEKESFERYTAALADINTKTVKECLVKAVKQFNEESNGKACSARETSDRISALVNQNRREVLVDTVRKSGMPLLKALESMKYQAVLNINQHKIK